MYRAFESSQKTSALCHKLTIFWRASIVSLGNLDISLTILIRPSSSYFYDDQKPCSTTIRNPALTTFMIGRQAVSIEQFGEKTCTTPAVLKNPIGRLFRNPAQIFMPRVERQEILSLLSTKWQLEAWHKFWWKFMDFLWKNSVVYGWKFV